MTLIIQITILHQPVCVQHISFQDWIHFCALLVTEKLHSAFVFSTKLFRPLVVSRETSEGRRGALNGHLLVPSLNRSTGVMCWGWTPVLGQVATQPHWDLAASCHRPPFPCVPLLVFRAFQQPDGYFPLDSIWSTGRVVCERSDLLGCKGAPAGSSDLLLPPAASLAFPCKLCPGSFATDSIAVVFEQGKGRAS